ncbi:MAG: LON peptidase substrate-binding domain-containing protein [Pseudomonadota bacterium]
MSAFEIPLFPLGTVLFPGGPLPLRIFETRYTDMIGQCMRDESLFGVVGISEGRDVGPSEIHKVGTTARITDFYQGSDGLLGITAIGETRFQILEERTQADGLRIALVESLPAAETEPLPDRFGELVDILESVLDDLGKLYADLPRRMDDATWVGYRFCEILPIGVARKQYCLEHASSIERLEFIEAVLSQARRSKSSDD